MTVDVADSSVTVVGEVAQVVHRQPDQSRLAGLAHEGDVKDGEKLRKDGEDVDTHP
jgi:hypothetical protein